MVRPRRLLPVTAALVVVAAVAIPLAVADVGPNGATDSVDSVEADDDALRVGSTARVKQPKLPPATWRVTELVPGRSFTWVARAPGLTSTGSHELEEFEGVTSARLSLRQSGPLAPLMRLLIGRLTERYVELEARGLKQRSEAGH